MISSVALKALKSRYTGWIVAAGVILWFSLNPQVKTVERIEWREQKDKRTHIATATDIDAGPGSVTEIKKDGTIVITGPVAIKSTRSETGTERTTTEGTHTKTTTPVGWKARVGASVLVPPPCKFSGMRKQLEADVRIGKILIFDVGAGARFVFSPASWNLEYYGVGLSLTF